MKKFKIELEVHDLEYGDIDVYAKEVKAKNLEEAKRIAEADAMDVCFNCNANEISCKINSITPIIGEN